MKLGRIEIPFGAQNLVIESGKLAKQANGAVTVTVGGTVVLVTACMSSKPKEGIDFFPLMVEYQEKTYSAGRIPGGFFKREGRPTGKEILTARVIDRPVRPLFPQGFYNEVQIVASVLSHDGENDPDVPALIGASAALVISDIPFAGAIGAVRVAVLEDKIVMNPTYEQRKNSSMEFIVAGHERGICMIEGEGYEVSEDKVLEAFRAAQEALIPLARIQNELQKQVGVEKTKITVVEENEVLINKVRTLASERLKNVYRIKEKQAREKARRSLLEDLTKDMSIYEEYKRTDTEEIKADDIAKIFEVIEYEEVRRMIFEERRRADDRGLKDIRPLSCEVNVLPRTHGSSLFSRGQTQSLAIVTLGAKRDEQMIESLEETTYKRFILHYNFPSFSVGETKPMRGPGRREIGHGALAEKAIQAVFPDKENFPYTTRIVSEILESNGSSSMASVCAGTLSLMDAGVPIKAAVAGISIGLVTKDHDALLITDIMGLEDHFGDMDFKVAGTRKGITAIQLDLKITEISVDLLEQALEQAREARMIILDAMEKAIAAPRKNLSDFAPRILTCHIPVDKIGEVIGPGGKVIKKIMEDTGATSIDIDDDGTVLVSADKKEVAEKAVNIINGMMEAPEVGKTYPATVKRIMNFGAFCEFLPGKEGLVHVSELSDTYVKEVEKVVKVGDMFNVKVIEIDKMNRVNLSKKQAEQKTASINEQ